MNLPKKEYITLRRCGSKKRHISEQNAKCHKGSLDREYPGVKHEVYFCDLCGFWHVGQTRTSPPQRNKNDGLG